MNNDSFLYGKTVYICSPLRDDDLTIQTENSKKAERYVIDFEEEYGGRAIAPQAYLPYLLNDKNPKEREMVLSWCLQLLDMCDAIIVYGDHLSDGMRIELNYALQHRIPIISRPESFSAVHAYLQMFHSEEEG